MKKTTENEITTSRSETKAERDLRERIETLRTEFGDIGRNLVNKSACYFDNLAIEEIFKIHSKLFFKCANVILARQGKTFVLDDENRDVIKFLLYYFNYNEKALEIFPNCNLNKNILLCGKAGVGKTLLMDAFAMYLKETKNPRAFYSVSQTQMLNYYRSRNTIDKFTFNEDGARAFDGNPVNICLNDVGLKTQKFYGNDMQVLIDEFLYARYEIWTSQGKFAHITTNLDKQDINDLFNDKFGRLSDRFKMYNVIPMYGESRR